MFKFLLKIAFLGAVVYGVYYYVTQDPFAKPETVKVPAISYEQATSGARSPEEAEPTKDPVDEPTSVQDTNNDPIEQVPEATEPSTATDLPTQFNLAVPFTSQSPNADWGLPYQEACEEASAYMVSEYYKGRTSGVIGVEEADTAILEAVSFEQDFLGDYLDTTATQTAQFIDNFYGLSAIVIENPTPEDIKREVATGRPVIVPAAGRKLGNPHFSGLGPLYHMLVIKGYTENQFITNDPGTRFGEGYVYDIPVLMEAMGDWNNGDPATGPKRVIFVNPDYVPVAQ